MKTRDRLVSHALPIRETEPYTIRHGQGYSVFEHTSHGISQELLLFAPLDGSGKDLAPALAQSH